MTEKKRNIKSDLTRAEGYELKRADYDEAPELSDEQIAQAVVRKPGRPAGQTKTQVTLRLDNDLLAAYRATGDGWQGRINADLRRVRKMA